MHLEAAGAADGALGIGQTDRQTQAQQIRHALFQVVAGHGQIAQVQVGGRVVGGGDCVHAAAQGEAALTVQRVIDHHQRHLLACLHAGIDLAQRQRIGVLFHRGDTMLVDDHVGDGVEGILGEDAHRHRLHLFQLGQRVEAADVLLGIQRLAAGGESHPDQLARLGQQFALAGRIGNQRCQQGRIHARTHQPGDHFAVGRFQGIGDGVQAGDGAVPGLGLGLVPGAGGGRRGEEVGQLDGTGIDSGQLGQPVERGARAEGGGQRIFLLLRQELFGVQLGQEGVAAGHGQGVGTRQAGVALGILLPQGGRVQGRALQHGCRSPFHRHQHVGTGLGTEPVGEDDVIGGDAGGSLEQALLQGDQTVDGLLLGIAANVVLVVAVVAAGLDRVAAAVLEGVGGHDHVVGGGVQRFHRHQIQLAGRSGHHEVRPVGQHLLHAARTQGCAVKAQLQQVERGHRGGKLGGSRCLDCDAGRGDGHDLDGLGRGPAIQGRHGRHRVGEIRRFGGEFQGAIAGPGRQGTGAHCVGTGQQIVEIAGGVAFVIVTATTAGQHSTDDCGIN